jgi:hypothetical protein
LPQAIVPFFVALGASATTAAILAQITFSILINVALGAISKALFKQPRLQRPPINVTIRNPVENRRLVWGTVRCGGTFAFFDTSGTNSKFLWYVVLFAGHQVAAIKDVSLDTQVVANSAIGGGAAEGGAVTTGFFANKLTIYKFLGTQGQAANTNLTAAFPSVWTSNHRLRGCAGVIVKMEKDDNAYPQGAPQNVTAVLDGALLYDPRKDSTNGGSGTHRRTDPSTWEFGTIGRNPALIWRWFVSGGSVHNDSTTRLIKYGLRESDSRMADAKVIAAANKCDEVLTGANQPPGGDEPRYRCDLEVSTGETRRSIIEDILATMAGVHVVAHGQHHLYAGAYDSPTHTFTAADLTGELEIEDTVDHRRRFNAVAGVFRSAANQYVEQTTPFRTDSAYETQDGGKRIPVELDLRGVTSRNQAQRLCEIKLRQSRMMRAVKLRGGLDLLKVAQWETLQLSHERFTWSNRVFRCVERQLDLQAESGMVELTCQREDAGVYADMVTANYITGTSDTDVFRNETPDPPSNLRTTGLQNAVLLQWDRGTVTFPGTSYELRESASISMTSPTTVYAGPDQQSVLARTSITDAYFQARSLRNQQVSDWIPAGNGVLGRASAVSAALSASASPGSATSSTGSASQVTNAVVITPTGGTSPYTYAWTWQSGGASITIDSPSAASCTFSATGLTSGETRSGTARCTVTDALMATFTVDVPVTITRAAPSIIAPAVSLTSFAIGPADASCAFKVDNDGKWYYSVNTAAPTLGGNMWSDPVEFAADYEIKVTRTGGTETVFTSGPALGSWHSLGTDREWRLTETANIGFKDIIFTIEIRRIADSGGLVSTTGNTMESSTETGA